MSFITAQKMELEKHNKPNLLNFKDSIDSALISHITDKLEDENSKNCSI